MTTYHWRFYHLIIIYFLTLTWIIFLVLKSALCVIGMSPPAMLISVSKIHFSICLNLKPINVFILKCCVFFVEPRVGSFISH